MILWNSVQRSKQIRKYLPVINIFVYNAHSSCKIKNLDKSRALCIRNYDSQLFQNISYFELLVNQFRQCNSNIAVNRLKFEFG